jgi:hypothetical protein
MSILFVICGTKKIANIYIKIVLEAPNKINGGQWELVAGASGNIYYVHVLQVGVSKNSNN